MLCVIYLSLDFEIELDELERAEDLYKRLLDRTKHVKVWISYAQFQQSVGKHNCDTSLSYPICTITHTPNSSGLISVINHQQ